MVVRPVDRLAVLEGDPMKPTRDDLWITRWIEGGPRDGTHDFIQPTDEEFDQIATAEGYVKLDVDVEALRESLWHAHGLDDDNPLAELARQVLAALDREGEA